MITNEPLRNKTILVVDDDPDTCELLRCVLQEAGAQVTVANSVEAVLDIYRHSPPHAVIADIRLRTSDGYALIKAIRDTDEEYRGFTPVVAVTGYSSPDDQQRAKSAGFNAYIAKPFDPSDVVDRIAELVSQTGKRVA